MAGLTPRATVAMMAVAPWVGAYALAGVWVGLACRWLASNSRRLTARIAPAAQDRYDRNEGQRLNSDVQKNAETSL